MMRLGAWNLRMFSGSDWDGSARMLSALSIIVLSMTASLVVSEHRISVSIIVMLCIATNGRIALFSFVFYRCFMAPQVVARLP